MQNITTSSSPSQSSSQFAYWVDQALEANEDEPITVNRLGGFFRRNWRDWRNAFGEEVTLTDLCYSILLDEFEGFEVFKEGRDTFVARAPLHATTKSVDRTKKQSQPQQQQSPKKTRQQPQQSQQPQQQQQPPRRQQPQQQPQQQKSQPRQQQKSPKGQQPPQQHHQKEAEKDVGNDVEQLIAEAEDDSFGGDFIPEFFVSRTQRKIPRSCDASLIGALRYHLTGRYKSYRIDRRAIKGFKVVPITEVAERGGHKINAEKFAAVAEGMLRGDIFEPIALDYSGLVPTIVDGYHRYWVSLIVGFSHIPVWLPQQQQN